MKPNSSVAMLVQMEYGQENGKPCTRAKNRVSLEKFTSTVPANVPSMTKSKSGEEKGNESIKL